MVGIFRQSAGSGPQASGAAKVLVGTIVAALALSWVGRNSSGAPASAPAHSLSGSIFDNDNLEPPKPAKKFVKPKPMPQPDDPPEPDPNVAPPTPLVEPPDWAQWVKADERAKRLFAVGLADQTVTGRRKLAAQMQQTALTQEEPAMMFVMLSDAREIAAGAGDAAGISSATAAITKRFQLTEEYVFKTKLSALNTALAITQREVKGPNAASAKLDARAITSSLLETSDAAIEAAEWDAASQAAQMAVTAAKTGVDARLYEAANAKLARVQALAQDTKDYEDALDVLGPDPDDAHANLTAGMFLCAIRHRYYSGCRHLAKCGETELEELANRELTPPLDAPSREILASAWWDQAEQATPIRQEGLRRRAIYWYEKALPKLTGKLKNRAQARIASVSGPATRPGN